MVTWIGSPYFGYDQGMHGRNGHKPIAVVMHIAQGTLAGVDAWFNSPDNLRLNGGSSSHYCIGKDGSIHSYVKEEDAAWANGQVKNPTWPLLLPNVNPNLLTISIEHEGLTGEPWTEAMLAADVQLIREIRQRWSIPLDRDHIIGHNQIDSVDRPNCPGTGLPWDLLMSRLRASDMMVVTARLQDRVRKLMGVFPWGMKEAWRRGYIPFADQVGEQVNGITWFAQPARRPDGSLCLLVYQEGHYTAAETQEAPFA